MDISVQCPTCGPGQATADNVVVLGDDRRGRCELAFRCPGCGARHAQPATVADVAAAVVAGCDIVSVLSAR